MLKYLLPATFLLIAPRLMAQQCECATEFTLLKADIEKNYAGFKDKVNSAGTSSYEAFSRNILRRARSATKPIYCFGLMQEWFAFFKDGHTQVARGDGAAIIDPAESLPIPDENNTLLKENNGIEGIYYNADATYKIAIIGSKTDFRDYAGVVLTSKSPEWRPGQVKLELQRITGTSFRTYVYNRDHSVQLTYFSFDGNSLNDGAWIKQGAVAKRSVSNAEDIQWMNQAAVRSRRISDQILYISIASFEVSNIHAIDSVFKANEGLLRSTPYLILDVRGNAGGGDASFGAIIPWLYTNPIYTIGLYDWASKDNIDRWGKFLNDPEMPASTKEEVKKLIAKLQAHAGQFVQTGKSDTLTLAVTEPYPKKVVVLINRRCASATEEFLLESVQSKKVTLMGQHTAGILDYANELVVPFPCMPFLFFYASSRSARIDQGKGIDNRGIQPRIPLSDDKNWIIEAKKFLEKG